MAIWGDFQGLNGEGGKKLRKMGRRLLWMIPNRVCKMSLGFSYLVDSLVVFKRLNGFSVLFPSMFVAETEIGS